jgi:biopolymer transport protein ExbD
MSFGRLERTSAKPPMSDINMTPLIDVMLVLLVIFMVTAPLMASSLRLDLPAAEGAAPVDTPPALRLALDAEGRLFLDEERIELSALRERAAAAAKAQPRTEVQLRADARVPYGRVAELIGLLQVAGLSRIGFVATPVAAAAAP